MRFKGKYRFALILILSMSILTSCDDKKYLTKINFDVSYDISLFDASDVSSYSPLISLFDKKDILIDFFTTNPYATGDKFYYDIEQFEDNYGFDNYIVLYFGKMLNISSTVDAFISEISNENVDITFEYDTSTSDITLPAEAYCQNFYLIDRTIFNDKCQTITFKIGNKVIQTEDYMEDVL